MNTLKATPLLVMMLVSLVALPASAQSRRSSQLVAQAGVNVQVEVNTSSKKSRGHTRKKSRRGDNRSSRRGNGRGHRDERSHNHRSGHDHQHTHTVVHEHVVVHEYVPAPPPPPQYYPMADDQFAQLIVQIQDQAFSSEKLSVITMAAEYNYFTSAQTHAVVSSLTFSADKVEAAVRLYPQVLDPETFYQVLSAFTFESSKNEVRARLGI